MFAYSGHLLRERLLKHKGKKQKPNISNLLAPRFMLCLTAVKCWWAGNDTQGNQRALRFHSCSERVRREVQVCENHTSAGALGRSGFGIAASAAAAGALWKIWGLQGEHQNRPAVGVPGAGEPARSRVPSILLLLQGHLHPQGSMFKCVAPTFLALRRCEE